MKEKYLVVFVTVGNKDEAEKITKTIVEGKLAACVNIVPDIKSYYWWKGKTEWSDELLLIIKTKYSKVDALIKKIKSIHSYTVAEIISLPIIKGNKPYLDWISESLKVHVNGSRCKNRKKHNIAG